MKTVQKKGFLLFLVLFHIGFIKAQESTEVLRLITPRSESKINVTIQKDALAEAIVDNNEEINGIQKITINPVRLEGNTIHITEVARNVFIDIPVNIGVMIIGNQVFYDIECQLNTFIGRSFYRNGRLGQCKHEDLRFQARLIQSIDIGNEESMVHTSFEEDFRDKTVFILRGTQEEEKSVQIVTFATPKTASRINVIIRKDALREAVTENNDEISTTSKMTIAPQPSKIREYENSATSFSIPVNIETIVVDGEVFNNIECSLYAYIGSHYISSNLSRCTHENLEFTRSLIPFIDIKEEDSFVHVAFEPEEDFRNRTVIIRNKERDAQ